MRIIAMKSIKVLKSGVRGYKYAGFNENYSYEEH